MRIPAALKHPSDASPDAELQSEARVHVEQHPGLRFFADVLAALHATPHAARSAGDFLTAFPPKDVLSALGQRPDLRVKVLRAIAGGPAALIRRLSAADLATQVDLLVSDDLPASERQVRAEEDRALSVPEIYRKYLDPIDLATYLPARRIWQYESQDDWWTQEGRAGARDLMAAELRSARKHALVSETEILDVVGDESLERDLPLAVRVRLRGSARKAGGEGRAFTDADLFACLRSDGRGDLLDELAEHLPLLTLRKVITHVIEELGLEEAGDRARTPPPAPRRAATPPPGPRTPPPLTNTRTSPAARSGPPSALPTLPRPGGIAEATPSLAGDTFGRPVDAEIDAMLDDLASPRIVVSGEKTSDHRR